METLTKQWTQGKTPGQIIDEMRRDRAWEIVHLTQALGIQEWETVCLLADEAPIDFAMADRLANAFQTSAQFWLCLHATHAMRTGSVILAEAQAPQFLTVAPDFINAEKLNKKLIAALASLCLERLEESGWIPGVMFASMPAGSNALELLTEIGVTVETADGEYEFAPGFDPATGEWQ